MLSSAIKNFDMMEEKRHRKIMGEKHKQKIKR
jgi:hypothetical protein